MKRLIIILLALLFCTMSHAQKKNVPIWENNEIFATVGVNVPMYRNIESDVLVGIHYGHYYPDGIGFRAGFQYSPSVSDIDNCFGVPMAFTFRTRSRSMSSRLDSATMGAVTSAVYSDDNAFAGGIAGFLMNLFDRMEFYAGLTPGYAAGTDDIHTSGDTDGYWAKTWTEKPYGFSLSVDGGFNINFKIWHFDLKLMPAFHYYLTENYIYRIDRMDPYGGIVSKTVRPIRWFFTFSGGLALRF